MLLFQVFLIFRVICAVAGGILQRAEAVESNPQYCIAVVVQCAVIYSLGVLSEIKAVNFVPCEESFFDQLLQVN